MSSSSQYISVRETAQVLGVSEKKVMDLIEEHKLQAYKIANKFLRLKKSEVLDLQKSGIIQSENGGVVYTKQERINDFFYYNNFYLACTFIIIVLLYIIFFVS